MSGIEIVGVVLGAFPVAIELFSAWETGFSKLKDWWSFKRTFRALVRSVQDEHVQFQMTLWLLLDPVIKDDEIIGEMIANPGGQKWKDHSHILDIRLLEYRSHCIAILQDIQDGIQELNGYLELGIDRETGWLRDGKLPFKYQFQRARLSFSSAAQNSIARVSQLNKQFRNVLKYGDNVVPIRNRRSTDPVILYFEKAQDLCKRLYTAIMCRWKCGCSLPHRTILLLGDSRVQRVAEQVLLSFNLQNASRGLLYRQVLATKNVAITMIATSNGQCISDLCTALYDGSSVSGYITDWQDERYNLLEHTVQSTETQPQPLSAMISSSNFSRRQRLETCIAVVISLLQVHLTPWTSRSTWCKEKVHFTTIEGEIRLAFPEDFVSNLSDSPQPPSATSCSRAEVISIMESIGVLLLELTLNQTIEAHPERPKFFGPDNLPHDWTDSLTAKLWCQDIEDDSGRDIYSAIQRCLMCNFGEDPDFDGKEFRAAIIANVVEPFQLAYRRQWPSTYLYRDLQ